LLGNRELNGIEIVIDDIVALGELCADVLQTAEMRFLRIISPEEVEDTKSDIFAMAFGHWY
jgi:hypothetical protein